MTTTGPQTSTEYDVSRRLGQMLVDASAILVIVAAVLWPLRSTFAGEEMLVTGMIAGALGVALAAATVRAPGVVVAASIPIGWVLLGGPVALRREGLMAGVPDATTLADVMAGSWSGWGDVLTTLPSVDMAGPPALIPFDIAYLGASVAAALAFRGRSPALPALPLLLAASTALLMGRAQPAQDPWLPLILAALVLAWVILRGHRDDRQRVVVRTGARGAVTRGLAVLAVLALVLGPAQAQVGLGEEAGAGVTLRGRVGELPDTSDLDRPLSRFRTFTLQRRGAPDNVYRKRLFTVSGVKQGARVRLVTLDRYNGATWLAENDTMAGTVDDRFLRMDTQVESSAGGRPIEATVEVGRAYRAAWVPTIGSLTSFGFLYTDVERRREMLRYNPATSTAMIPIGLAPGTDYQFTAVVPDDRLSPKMRPWPEPILDVAGTLRVKPFLKAWDGGKKRPMERVLAVAEHLRSQGRYSDGALVWEQQYAPGHDLDRLLGSFLSAPLIVGDDEQYAAAMALLANAAGVPARVVVGAELPKNGIVRGKDVHAWVEVRIADGSWRTLPTKTFMSTESPDPDYEQPKSKPERPDERDDEREDRDRVRFRGLDAKGTARGEQLIVPDELLWLLLLPAAWVAPVLIKGVRRYRRRTRGRPSDRMAGAWAELIDTSLDLGARVPAEATRPVQARTLVAAGNAAALSTRADDGTFAPLELSEEEVVDYWDQVSQERAHLRAQAAWWRRWWAPVSPASIFRRGQRRGWAEWR